MNLTVNGTTRETPARTVRELVEELNMARPGVAVEVNRQLVPRKLHEQTELHEGDAVEVVSLVGGG
ncbi:MAG: sulfur carrier protein ThiS [Phycisphaeraceae bacterium]